MSSFWLFLGRHAASVKAGSALLAVLLLVAGLALGIQHGRSVAPSPVADASETVPIAARIATNRHTVIGVVRTVSPDQFLVRNPRGTLFVVRWGAQTHFRTGGHDVPPSSLRPGDRVVILGRASADGSLHATLVSIVRRGPATTAAFDQSPTAAATVPAALSRGP